ncbi:unnamed protein product [Durusdinium trenchii]|uniref:Uncharacterized protein n=1 Tax=Durusdinium trenchii TaxID=1381693 RepID=A0ABP0MD12_9DINO
MYLFGMVPLPSVCANGRSVECQRPRRAELEHLLSSKPWRGKWQFQCSHSPAASLLQPGLPFAGLLVVLGLVCLREQSKEIRRRTLRRVREERSARSNGRRKMSNDSEVADRLVHKLCQAEIAGHVDVLNCVFLDMANL